MAQLVENRNEDEVKMTTETKNLTPKMPETKNRLRRTRSSTQFTLQRLQCWFSIDIHLNDIVLVEEAFKITAHLDVSWKDMNGDFIKLFDQDALASIKQHGFISYSDLSLDVRKKLLFNMTSFLHNAHHLDIRKCHLELYDEAEGVWKIYILFDASCAERMELDQFPFDAQFLNMQLMYKTNDYFFLSECPEWLKKDDRYLLFNTHRPIKLTVNESLKSQWKIEEPWIDMRQDRGIYNFPFSLIRLRIRREPAFYLLNGVLPLFLVIMCSFASFVMPVEEFLDGKLGYIITLLLTTAAFQYALSSDLPKSQESTMIDVYILYAYGILSFFTFEIAIVYKLYDSALDTMAAVFDYATVGVFALIWLWKSGQFLYMWWKITHSEIDWQKLSEVELKGWSVGKGVKIDVAEGQHLGTYDL